MSQQLGLFSKGDAATLDGSPADPWADPATEATAVDEIFVADSRYRSSREYLQILNLIARLPQYSAFNGFLLYTQNPALSHVATARTWARQPLSVGSVCDSSILRASRDVRPLPRRRHFCKKCRRFNEW